MTRASCYALASVAAALVSMLITSCDGQTGPLDYERAVELSVNTGERVGDRSYLVVGGSGWASVTIHGDFNPYPRDLEIRSSEPSVVSVGPVTDNNDAGLFALTPGTVQITARALGMPSAPEVIEVTAEPLPVDSLQLGLTAAFGAGSSSRVEVPAAYDASGNLVEVTLSVGVSADLYLQAFRAGLRMTQIPYSIASSNPSVARTDSGCRPRELDSDCMVVGWIWLSGMAPGEAQITLTVRNLQASFLVKVR